MNPVFGKGIAVTNVSSTAVRHSEDTDTAGYLDGNLMKINPARLSPINIGVVEDDPLRLIGFQSILDRIPHFLVAEVSVAELTTNRRVQVILLGNHSGLKFVETMATMKIVRPDLRVLVTGISMNDENILKVIMSGGKGYFDEAGTPNDLVQAIYTIHQGSVWVPRRVISMFIERSGDLLKRRSQPGYSTLTTREKQVLQMLVEGRSNKEIGTPLGIEERTVKAHVAKMMRKVGVKNRIALTVHAVNHSLVCAQ